MLTTKDVNAVVFEKAMRGYRPESVDNFLDKVVRQLDDDTKTIATLKKEVEALEEKMCILAQRIEEYEEDENTLKSALLNAQRMGESIINEAQQKADATLHESKQKADTMLHEASVRAENLTRLAIEENRDQEVELERVKKDVSDFKANVLNLYRQHIQSLSTLPDYDNEDNDLDDNLDSISDVNEQTVSFEDFTLTEDKPHVAEETISENSTFQAPSEPIQEEMKPEEVTTEEVKEIRFNLAPSDAQTQSVEEINPFKETASETFQMDKLFENVENDYKKQEEVQSEAPSVEDAFKGIQFSD